MAVSLLPRTLADPASFSSEVYTASAYEQFLHTVFDGAVATRETRSVERRIRGAGFPSTTKTLESYDFTAQPALRKTVVLQLATLDFIRRKEGVHRTRFPWTPDNRGGRHGRRGDSGGYSATSAGESVVRSQEG